MFLMNDGNLLQICKTSVLLVIQLTKKNLHITKHGPLTRYFTVWKKKEEIEIPAPS